MSFVTFPHHPYVVHRLQSSCMESQYERSNSLSPSLISSPLPPPCPPPPPPRLAAGTLYAGVWSHGPPLYCQVGLSCHMCPQWTRLTLHQTVPSVGCSHPGIHLSCCLNEGPLGVKRETGDPKLAGLGLWGSAFFSSFKAHSS